MRASTRAAAVLLASALSFTASPAALAQPGVQPTATASTTTLTTTLATTTATGPEDLLAVSVVGDGTSSGNVAVPVTIQTVKADGELITAIPMPTTAEGDQHAFTLGADRDQAGALQQSADRRYVTLGGYDAEPGWTGADGSTSLNGSTSDEVTRVIGRIDASGAVDTSTTVGGAYNTRHIRGVVTDDGTRYWTGGHGNDTTGEARGGVLYVEHGSTTPTPVTSNGGQVNNTRVPGIHDGQLFVTSDRSDYDGLNAVGEGLPTTDAAMSLLGRAPADRTIAHDFAFVGEHLYVAYTSGDPGIVRYGQDAEGAWTAEAAFPGEYWGLTGREAGDDVLLYAVLGSAQGNELHAILDEGQTGTVTDADTSLVRAAEPGYAFRGVDFAPGYTPGSEAVDLGEADLQVNWDRRVAGGVGNALSAVLGAESNPVATGRLADPAEDNGAGPFEVSVSSNNQAVVTDADLDLTVAADGTFTLAATPSGTGQAVLTITVTAEDGRSMESRLDYWVSAALPDETALAHVGMADASAAEYAGDGHWFVADDDSNQIRLYGSTFGEPVAEFEIGAIVDPVQSGQTWDLEASARQGDVIYWVGSMGNTRSGNVRLDRDIVVATRVAGTGADATLTPIGYTRGVRQALVDWDAAGAHGLGANAFQFARATQDGYSAEGPNSLNVEGAAMAPDGTTLWLGFRSPLTPLENGDTALIVSVPNIAAVTGGADVEIGEHISLDLDGRAIRAMARTQDGKYLIMGGSADDAGNFLPFGWTGQLDDAPVPARTAPGVEGWTGSYESLPLVPSLEDGTVIRLMQDVGTMDLYGTGSEAQDLAREHMKFISHDYTLDFGGAFSAGTPAPTPTPATCEVSNFSDNPVGSRFYAPVRWMQCEGITTGYADGAYRKNRDISRGESVAFLYRYFDGETQPSAQRFGDVPPTHTFYAAIAWAAENGVTRGYTWGGFAPAQAVTRGEFAAFLYRAVGPEHEGPVDAEFSDVPVGYSHYQAVTWMASEGISIGYRDGTFRPHQPITRGEVAALLHRYDVRFGG
ncbi:MAG: S-layer homology domain-containing protein [Micrococcus sp.]|nr:S-layer homology domain-containing protein [Micrococcus sp.]